VTIAQHPGIFESGGTKMDDKKATPDDYITGLKKRIGISSSTGQ
jgi:hypothetical protein